MATSQNGWPASPDPAEIDVQPCAVAGVPIGDGLKAAAVTTVLSYVLLQLHLRVEPLLEGQCWGYKYRPVTGGTELSNHASATAVDVNAPVHPLGQRGTFSSEQVDEIHRVLAEVGGVVRWGGDYDGRVDEMHFEIDSTPESVAAVAARLEARMVTFGLDISHHQDLALDLARCRREGIEFVFIKATQGATYNDPEFAANLAEARAAGQLVAAYHYQSTEPTAAQVANVRDSVPLDVPVVLDVESGSGSVAVTRDLIARLRQAGYRVPLLYLPRWYWQQLGSPSLAGLPPLWSSRYPDHVVGSIADEWAAAPASYWTGYGGLDVAVLQFTSSAAIAGYQPLDANAYRGTRAQLAALLGGGTPIQEDEVSVFPDIASQDNTYTAVKNLLIDAAGGNRPEVVVALRQILGIEDLMNAVHQVATGDIDEAALAVALGPILAPLVHAGATPEQVEAAVRHVFASVGQTGATEGGQ